MDRGRSQQKSHSSWVCFQAGSGAWWCKFNNQSMWSAHRSHISMLSTIFLLVMIPTPAPHPGTEPRSVMGSGSSFRGLEEKMQMTQLKFPCGHRRSSVTAVTALGIPHVSWGRTKAIIEMLHCTRNWTSVEDEATSNVWWCFLVFSKIWGIFLDTLFHSWTQIQVFIPTSSAAGALSCDYKLHWAIPA